MVSIDLKGAGLRSGAGLKALGLVWTGHRRGEGPVQVWVFSEPVPSQSHLEAPQAVITLLTHLPERL